MSRGSCGAFDLNPAQYRKLAATIVYPLYRGAKPRFCQNIFLPPNAKAFQTKRKYTHTAKGRRGKRSRAQDTDHSNGTRRQLWGGWQMRLDWKNALQIMCL